MDQKLVDGFDRFIGESQNLRDTLASMLSNDDIGPRQPYNQEESQEEQINTTDEILKQIQKEIEGFREDVVSNLEAYQTRERMPQPVGRAGNFQDLGASVGEQLKNNPLDIPGRFELDPEKANEEITSSVKTTPEESLSKSEVNFPSTINFTEDNSAGIHEVLDDMLGVEKQMNDALADIHVKEKEDGLNTTILGGEIQSPEIRTAIDGLRDNLPDGGDSHSHTDNDFSMAEMTQPQLTSYQKIEKSLGKMANTMSGISAGLLGGTDLFGVLINGLGTSTFRFRDRMDVLNHQIDRVTGSMEGLQNGFRELDDVSRRTGKLRTAVEEAVIKSLKKGTFQTKEAQKEMTLSALNLSTFLDPYGDSIPGEEISDSFNNWHTQLGFTSGEMAQMGRNIKDLSRTSQITGKELLDISKSTDEFMKMLRRNGSASLGVSAEFQSTMAEAGKLGVEEPMKKLLQTLSDPTGIIDNSAEGASFIKALGLMSGNIESILTKSARGEVLSAGDTTQLLQTLGDQAASVAGVADSAALKDLQRQAMMGDKNAGAKVQNANLWIRNFAKAHDMDLKSFDEVNRMIEAQQNADISTVSQFNKFDEQRIGADQETLKKIEIQESDVMQNNVAAIATELSSSFAKLEKGEATQEQAIYNAIANMGIDRWEPKFDGLVQSAEKLGVSQDLIKSAAQGDFATSVETRNSIVELINEVNKQSAIQKQTISGESIDIQAFDKLEVALKNGDQVGVADAAKDINASLQAMSIQEARNVNGIQQAAQTTIEWNDNIRETLDPVLNKLITLLGGTGIMLAHTAGLFATFALGITKMIGAIGNFVVGAKVFESLTNLKFPGGGMADKVMKNITPGFMKTGAETASKTAMQAGMNIPAGFQQTKSGLLIPSGTDRVSSAASKTKPFEGLRGIGRSVGESLNKQITKVKGAFARDWTGIKEGASKTKKAIGPNAFGFDEIGKSLTKSKEFISTKATDLSKSFQNLDKTFKSSKFATTVDDVAVAVKNSTQKFTDPVVRAGKSAAGVAGRAGKSVAGFAGRVGGSAAGFTGRAAGAAARFSGQALANVGTSAAIQGRSMAQGISNNAGAIGRGVKSAAGSMWQAGAAKNWAAVLPKNTGALTKVGSTLTKFIKPLTGALKFLTVGFKNLGKYLLGPFGWVIMGVADSFSNALGAGANAAKIFEKETTTLMEEWAAESAGLLTGFLNFLTFGLFAGTFGPNGTLTKSLAHFMKAFWPLTLALQAFMMPLKVIWGLIKGVGLAVWEMAKGLWDAIKEIGSAIAESADILMEPFNEIANDLKSAWDDALPYINAVSETVYGAVIMIAEAFDNIFGTDVAGWFGDFSSVFSIVDVLSKSLKAVGSILAPIIKYIGVFVGGALKGFVSSIAQVISGAWNIVKGISKIIGGVIKTLWNLVSLDFSEAGDGLKMIWGGVKNLLGGVFDLIWGGLKATVLRVPLMIWDGMVEVIARFMNSFNMPSFGDMFTGVIDGIAGIASSIGHGIKELFLSGLHVAGTFLNGMVNGFIANFANIITGIVKYFGGIWDVFTGIGDVMWSMLTFDGEGISNGLSKISDGILSAIGGAFETLAGMISMTILRIPIMLWDGIAAVMSDLTGLSIPSFDEIVDSVFNFGTRVYDGIKYYFDKAYDYLLGNSVIPDIYDGIVLFFGKIFDFVVGMPLSIMKFLVKLPLKIAGLFWDGLKGTGKAVVRGLESIFGEDLLETISDSFGNILGTITSAISSVGNFVGGIFTYIFDGAKKGWNQLKSVVTWVGDKITAVWNVIRGPIEWVLEKLESFDSILSTGKDIIGEVSAKAEAAWDWGTGVLDSITSFSANALSTIGGWASSGLDHISGWVGSSLKLFTDFATADDDKNLPTTDVRNFITEESKIANIKSEQSANDSLKAILKDNSTQASITDKISHLEEALRTTVQIEKSEKLKDISRASGKVESLKAKGVTGSELFIAEGKLTDAKIASSYIETHLQEEIENKIKELKLANVSQGIGEMQVLSMRKSVGESGLADQITNSKNKLDKPISQIDKSKAIEANQDRQLFGRVSDRGWFATAVKEGVDTIPSLMKELQTSDVSRTQEISNNLSSRLQDVTKYIENASKTSVDERNPEVWNRMLEIQKTYENALNTSATKLETQRAPKIEDDVKHKEIIEKEMTSSSKDLSELTHEATSAGSIYTHDVTLEKLLTTLTKNKMINGEDSQEKQIQKILSTVHRVSGVSTEEYMQSKKDIKSGEYDQSDIRNVTAINKVTKYLSKTNDLPINSFEELNNILTQSTSSQVIGDKVLASATKESNSISNVSTNDKVLVSAATESNSISNASTNDKVLASATKESNSISNASTSDKVLASATKESNSISNASTNDKVLASATKESNSISNASTSDKVLASAATESNSISNASTNDKVLASATKEVRENASNYDKFEQLVLRKGSGESGLASEIEKLRTVVDREIQKKKVSDPMTYSNQIIDRAVMGQIASKGWESSHDMPNLYNHSGPNFNLEDYHLTREAQFKLIDALKDLTKNIEKAKESGAESRIPESVKRIHEIKDVYSEKLKEVTKNLDVIRSKAFANEFDVQKGIGLEQSMSMGQGKILYHQEQEIQRLTQELARASSEEEKKEIGLKLKEKIKYKETIADFDIATSMSNINEEISRQHQALHDMDIPAPRTIDKGFEVTHPGFVDDAFVEGGFDPIKPIKGQGFNQPDMNFNTSDKINNSNLNIETAADLTNIPIKDKSYVEETLYLDKPGITHPYTIVTPSKELDENQLEFMDKDNSVTALDYKTTSDIENFSESHAPLGTVVTPEVRDGKVRQAGNVTTSPANPAPVSDTYEKITRERASEGSANRVVSSEFQKMIDLEAEQVGLLKKLVESNEKLVSSLNQPATEAGVSGPQAAVSSANKKKSFVSPDYNRLQFGMVQTNPSTNMNLPV